MVLFASQTGWYFYSVYYAACTVFFSKLHKVKFYTILHLLCNLNYLFPPKLRNVKFYTKLIVHLEKHINCYLIFFYSKVNIFPNKGTVLFSNLIYFTRIAHSSLDIKCYPGLKNCEVRYSQGNLLLFWQTLWDPLHAWG